MTTHVLIGVGGTGAKVVEAALYLFLAGLGPREVIVGLVDQDKANGNVNRTKTLINDIIRLREDFGPSKGNGLDWTTDGEAGGTWFGSVKITPLMGGDPHWRPSDDGPRTLADILGRAGMEQEPGLVDLFDVLFEPGKTEQDMPLDEGYRGRAHIGSAAMLASLESDQAGFKRRMGELIDRGGQNEEVRIFLVGSVFGGTGAAGFPTLARALAAIREAKAEKLEHLSDAVKIGGALMLPYFGFNDPKEAGANVVRNNDLIPQARSALEYYHQLFRHEPVFDRFYVAGWDRLFRMNYHKPGATGQINPAQPPELLGAMAVLDFFDAPLGRRSDTVPVMVSARGAAEALDWMDVPAETPLRHRVHDRLGRLTRTALFWRHEIEPELDRRKEFFHQKQPWMALAKDVKWEVHTPEAREHLLDLFGDYLTWAASMGATAQGIGGLKFDLWETTAAHDTDYAPDLEQAATHPIRVKSPGQGRLDVEQAFHRAFPPVGGTGDVRESHTVVTELSRRPQTANNAGLGKMLAAVYRAARPVDRATEGAA